MPKRKILIVEDDFILYSDLCEFFEEKGFAIVKREDENAVDNYEEAVQLLKLHKPDIAVLDIKLKGVKDGIDIGMYIKKHNNIPVIYLSGHSNPENLERLKEIGHDRFLLKEEKPVSKEGLWAMFYLALPTTSISPATPIGKFFNVKEVQVTLDSLQRSIIKEGSEPSENELLFKWEKIWYIRSYNKKTAGKGNNNVLIHTENQGKAFAARSSLDELVEMLPFFFARFNQSAIVNIKKITSRSHSKKELIYRIGELSFEVTDTYKNEVQAKISRFLSDSGMDNFPEK